MSLAKRKSELSWLNVWFCLLVVFIHAASQPVSVLDKLSWQYALVMIPQRLAFVAVPGFFLLSGVKLTLPRSRPQTIVSYWRGRCRSILLPYLLAVLVYYFTFVFLLRWFPFSWRELARYTVTGSLSAPFYFLIALFQFILLFPLFRWLARRWSAAVLLPFALGLTWVSSMYFNAVLQLFVPGAVFPYGDRVFTTYLFYYLAGCCIGAHYADFLKLLEQNRGLITALFLAFALADGWISWMAFSGRGSAPFLEIVHSLYIISAILFFYGLAQSCPSPLPRWAQAVDRASFLIYLYHCLVLTLFQTYAPRLGLTRTAPQFAGRMVVVYAVTIGACVLWQRLYAAVRARLLSGKSAP